MGTEDQDFNLQETEKAIKRHDRAQQLKAQGVKKPDVWAM